LVITDQVLTHTNRKLHTSRSRLRTQQQLG